MTINGVECQPSHHPVLLQSIHQDLISGLHGAKRVDMEDMLYISLIGLEIIKVALLVAAIAIALVWVQGI